MCLWAFSPIPELIAETRSLIEELQENLLVARTLRETSLALRNDNADYRDFLRENCLTVLSRYERETDNRNTTQAIPREPEDQLPATTKARHYKRMLQCFQLEHPDNEMVLCDRPKCDAIADYLEVEADGTEHHLCAFHTMSDKYASRLPLRAPDPKSPYRRLQII